MALIIVALLTVLPLVLLLADIVRPRHEVDRHAGPARSQPSERGVTLARPVVVRADILGEKGHPVA